ncbi:hypothetical protein THARTR1_08513 [Trichoderma harzianum]|uniref:Uncharacterized protein n=1 Tax=Trichoderma harzianum TaxID=5544 RepID=A0A2K0TZD1_TRIHA|nr:hypothetical protein THARTR1_08513 [Trichoderma harzianum]
MSTYNGRHGPNVSQYLRDLNTISPTDTTAVEEPFNNMEEDLALFTNTQFFDFDSGQNTDFQAQAQPVKTEGKAPHSGTTSEDVSAAPSVIGEMPNLDFMSGECFGSTCTPALLFDVSALFSLWFFFYLQYLHFPSFLEETRPWVFSLSSQTRAP